MRTQILRRQHDAALEIVTQMRGELATPQPDCAKLAHLLAKLTGLLRIHLAQEDNTLYPHMINSANAEASNLAKRFQLEMGGIGLQFASYSERWISPRMIAGSLELFRAETQAVFAALANRIERENRELYPRADALQPDEIARSA